MGYIINFESFITKIEEGLIKTYNIDKTIEDINRILTSYNLKYKLSKLNNNTFDLFIDDFDKISNLKEVINHILDTLIDLYGWFPSTLEVTNLFGAQNKFGFKRDYLLNPSNNLNNIKIVFESKFDLIENNIPDKMYHISIQQYRNNTLNLGLITKGKSKLTSHE